MTVKILGTNAREVFRTVCHCCFRMLEYGATDLVSETIGGYTHRHVVCPGCQHEVTHERGNMTRTVFDPVG